MVNNPYASSAVPRDTQCKCCGAPARLADVVDFSQSCMDVHLGRKVDPCCGWPIYYYYCEGCGFSFTRAFDDWTNEDFAAKIYNDNYALYDVEYEDIRPKYLSETIGMIFREAKNDARVLDYGSGSGAFETYLKGSGFTSVESYDPYGHTRRPTGLFDVITCAEVFEHLVNPLEGVSDIVSYMKDDGVIFFTTSLCTKEIVDSGLSNWSYCGPRNGHISFYSRETLFFLARLHSLNHAWFDEGRHIYYRGDAPKYLSAYW